MDNPPIYTSEPMATRALAAEIRQAPQQFVRLLERAIGVANLGELLSVRCEAEEQLDLELKFANPEFSIVGIEAKFDHELTSEQVDRELSVVSRLVILLMAEASAPEWLSNREHVSVITWEQTLACFDGSRLTLDDIRSMPTLKSDVEIQFRAQDVRSKLPGWRVDVVRGGGGMPAIVIESPTLANGRRLCGHIQISGRGMPKPPKPKMIEYIIGVSVSPDPMEFPDPTMKHAEPGWVAPLRTLGRLLDGDAKLRSVSTAKPGPGRSELGKHKVGLAEQHLPGATWLAKGYVDWALGIKSLNHPLDKLDELTSITVAIFLQWYASEVDRLLSIDHRGQ